MDVDSEALKSLTVGDLDVQCGLLAKAVQLMDKRYVVRVLRALPKMRKRLNVTTLGAGIRKHVTNDHIKIRLENLLGLNSAAMDTDIEVTYGQNHSAEEISVYFCLLVIVYLVDSKQLDQALDLSKFTHTAIQSYNRRTLDPLSAQVYYYLSLIHGKLGRLSDCRSLLLVAQRSAVIRRDDWSQAVLLNLLLYNYLSYGLFDQADKLAEKSSFPEMAENSQSVRYMYFVGRIKAIQLDYSGACRYLSQAARKAPQGKSAAGFLQTVNKFLVIVQLLMGEIPERSLFRQLFLRKPLEPYFQLVQAVRVGDLSKFHATLEKFGNRFREDKTFSLILRLRHNVIKTGIRMISVSYSRISLKDICLKLHLDCEEDAEFIVAKAIRDGVINGVIYHEQAFLKSKEVANVYGSREPQAAYNQRIQFCLDLHNDSVKAMRYPLNTTKKSSETNTDTLDIEREISELVDDDMEEEDSGF